MFIIIMGLYKSIALFLSFENLYPENSNILAICEIVSVKEESEYYDKYIVRVLENNNNPKSKNTKLIVFLKKQNDFQIGDIIKIDGEFEKVSKARNYKGFNYRIYLNERKIYGVVKVNKVIKITRKFNINIILQICTNKIKEIYKDEYANFLIGILLGNSSELSDEIKDNFRDSSVSHILAISGMHVSYIIIGVNFILERILKSKKLRNYILVVILIFYAIITGFSSSCVRACIMCSMFLISSNLHRKNIFYISFLLSFIFLILDNPYNIFNVGMWLSFLGTLGIVLFYNFFRKILYKKIKRLYKNFLCNNIKKEKLLKFKYNFLIEKFNLRILLIKMVDSFFISISAQILINPIILYSFNTESFTFFISNIIISLFIGPIIILGYISLIFSFLFKPFYKIITIFECFFIDIVLKITDICSKLPFSKIYFTTPKLISIILYYLYIFLLIYYSKRNKLKILRIILNKKYFINKIKRFRNILKNNNLKFREESFYELVIHKNKAKIQNKYLYEIIGNNKYLKIKENNKINLCKRMVHIIFIIVLIIILILNQVIIILNKNLRIYFVDVGQGDCTLIITPNNKKLIIDGGEGNSGKYDYGKNVVLPYLLDRGISKIDYLIISHCDSDHIGGLFAVIENIKVDKILIGKQFENSKQLEDLIEIAKKKKIDIIILESKNRLLIDKYTYIDVLWPDSDNKINENILNNNSLVFKLIYKNISILFTGDIEEIAEKKILQEYENKLDILNSTILKVGHHGSKTSSTENFIKKVNPKIALIGVGENNKFGHPNEVILNRLENIRL